MKTGLKRRAGDMAPTDESLFDPFVGNETYSARYHKRVRKVPKLDTRPFGEFACTTSDALVYLRPC